MSLPERSSSVIAYVGRKCIGKDEIWSHLGRFHHSIYTPNAFGTDAILLETQRRERLP